MPKLLQIFALKTLCNRLISNDPIKLKEIISQENLDVRTHENRELRAICGRWREDSLRMFAWQVDSLRQTWF